MKKLFFVLGCMLLLSSTPVLAQGDNPSVIVVRSTEAGNKLFIYTARGGEKVEMQEFKFPKDYYEQATAKYQQLITSYLEQGYVLQSMTVVHPSYPNTTFVFVKAPKS